jgi:hypothetical protein
MTDTYADSAFLREPGLWTPGRMPTGRVKLDNHPIANKLHSAYLLNTFGVYDLKGTVPRSAISVGADAGPTTVVLKGSAAGQALYWDRTDSNQVIIADLGTDFVFHTGQTMDFTVFHHLMLDPGVSGLGGAQDEFDFSVVNEGGSSSGYSASATELEDGNWHTVALASKNGDFLRIYLDGKSLAGGSESPTASRGGSHQFRYDQTVGEIEVTVTGAPGANLYIAGTGQKIEDRFWGQIGCSYFFQEALSDAEVKSLSSNPYQILAPA